MYEQTEDYRIGMIEGVLSCHIAGVLDTEDFWYTIDNVICAEHDKVIDRLKGFDFLDKDILNRLINDCPTNLRVKVNSWDPGIIYPKNFNDCECSQTGTGVCVGNC